MEEDLMMCKLSTRWMTFFFKENKITNKNKTQEKNLVWIFLNIFGLTKIAANLIQVFDSKQSGSNTEGKIQIY